MSRNAGSEPSPAGRGDVWVLKRDGTVEAFDSGKLRGCLLWAMGGRKQFVMYAASLAEALGCYLRRRGIFRASSGAVLEMALKGLRTIGHCAAAERLERAHSHRAAVRRRLTLRHGAGSATAWSKSWLAERARTRWSVGRTTARILAGRIERGLVRRDVRVVDRQEVLALLGRLVEAYGLARGRPVEAPASS